MTHKRRSLFFPVLLVGLGVVLLLNNLGLVSGSIGELLRTYWPVLLILAGLDALYQGEGWVWALVLLGLGTILLLGNLNYLPTSALPLLAKIWPVLLVAVGLDIAFGRRKSGWYAVLRVGVGMLLVGLILWLAISSTGSRNLQQQRYQQGLDGATSSSVSLSFITGRLTLQPGDKDQLITASADLPRGVELKPEYTAPKNGASALRYDMREHRMVLDSPSFLYNFKLNPAIPITLDAGLVVGEMTLNLQGTLINGLHTEMALGRQEVHLPCEKRVTGTIEMAVGELAVYIPQGCDVNIALEDGLVYTTLPEGYRRSGDIVTNDNAVNISGPLEVTIEAAVGAVSIHEE